MHPYPHWSIPISVLIGWCSGMHCWLKNIETKIKSIFSLQKKGGTIRYLFVTLVTAKRPFAKQARIVHAQEA